MKLSEALDTAETAYLVREGGDLHNRSLTLYVVHETDDGHVVEQRETEYEPLTPPRWSPSMETTWIPMSSGGERIDPDDVPTDVKLSGRWESTEADPDTLDRDGLDTAGKTLSALEGTPPEEAAQRDPEPPFTPEFGALEDTAEEKPGQGGEVKEGPPETGSHTEHLERIDE